MRRHPEAEFLAAAALTVATTTLVALPLSALLAGVPGLVGAAVALGLLVLLFGASALLHLLTARLGARPWVAVTVAGFGLRLVLYYVALRALAGVEALSGLALGLTAAAGILLGQVFEMRALVRARAASGEVAPGARQSEAAGDDAVPVGPAQGVDP